VRGAGTVALKLSDGLANTTNGEKNAEANDFGAKRSAAVLCIDNESTSKPNMVT